MVLKVTYDEPSKYGYVRGLFFFIWRIRYKSYFDADSAITVEKLSPLNGRCVGIARDELNISSKSNIV